MRGQGITSLDQLEAKFDREGASPSLKLQFVQKREDGRRWVRDALHLQQGSPAKVFDAPWEVES